MHVTGLERGLVGDRDGAEGVVPQPVVRDVVHEGVDGVRIGLRGAGDADRDSRVSGMQRHLCHSWGWGETTQRANLADLLLFHATYRL